jgi:porphobilinogen synthase
MRFPVYRPRRLRQNAALRALVRETELSVSHLVQPLFVREGRNVRKPIGSMPGQFQLSVDQLVGDAGKLGVPAVILFGIPDKKDEKASGAYAANGIVPKAVRALKKELPDLIVICDVCLCEYMSHGHCGVVVGRDKRVDNDATLPLLAKASLAYAEAGADIVAPSDMMDGRVAAIRAALDETGFADTPIMSYAAKFASAFYGPFREAAESPPKFGDRKTYQMDYANADEALREVALDIEEGADIVMVKPALAYMDLIRRVKEKFGYPVACYNVSGEYAMVKAAAKNGWLDEKQVVLEMLTGFKRAGADIILTYWAADVARWLQE